MLPSRTIKACPTLLDSVGKRAKLTAAPRCAPRLRPMFVAIRSISTPALVPHMISGFLAFRSASLIWLRLSIGNSFSTSPSFADCPLKTLSSRTAAFNSTSGAKFTLNVATSSNLVEPTEKIARGLNLSWASSLTAESCQTGILLSCARSFDKFLTLCRTAKATREAAFVTSIPSTKTASAFSISRIDGQ